MDATDRKRASEVIRFWRTIELFSPQTVPKVNPADKGFPVVPLRVGSPLPWQAGSALGKLKLKPGYTWQHTVYIGIYSIEDTFEVLRRVFEPGSDSYDDRPPGQSALAAFMVSADGVFLLGSELLSSCAWATGRAVNPGPTGPEWLQGLEAAQQQFTESLLEILADSFEPSRDEDQDRGLPVGRPLTHELLARIRDDVGEQLSVNIALSFAEIRIASRRVKEDNALDVTTNDFLNSFIVDDLQRVADAVSHGSVGQALGDYLREKEQIPESSRIDVQKRLDIVFDAISPANTPLGRWPASSAAPLASSQQLAVNSIFELLGDSSGMFAVNGPPGTGKTTMLRELVAAIIVKRACVLAKLADPNDAFVGLVTWKTGERSRTVQVWKEELTGFEVVVASSNNGAVQNVTDEIPGISAIDTAEWLDKADYFRDIATSLLRPDRKVPVDDANGGRPGESEVGDDGKPDVEDVEEPSSTPEAWALMAGRLGNMKNRRKFSSGFWFDSEVDSNSTDSDQTDINAKRMTLGMDSVLKQLIATPPSQTWAEAVADFQRRRDHTQRVLDRRLRAFNVGARIAKARQDGQSCEWRIAEAEAKAEGLHASLRQLRVELEKLTNAREDLLRIRREYGDFRPGLLESLFTAGKKMRSWSVIDTAHASALSESEDSVRLVAADIGKTQELLNHARAVADESRATARAAAEDLSLLEQEQSADRQRWGEFVPDAAWWSNESPDRRELKALWLDPEVCAARTEMFLAALNLHRVFIGHTAKGLRHSLRAARELIIGEVPGDLESRKALAAWQTLFFVVPVVSTTFASFARVFSHLGSEEIGWLLIDEAGQSTPQNAVGALWRSRRAVIVGDPLQLEPIVAIPFRAQQAIRSDHGVSERWLPANTSVQRLADSGNTLGTWTTDEDDGSTWVGCPLRVHRRCDSPMFEIIRDMVYKGLIINGGLVRDELVFPRTGQPVPASRWINVVSQASDGNFIPSEYAILLDRLANLKANRQDMSEVFVISPFRDVARRLNSLQELYGARFRSGTIHTAQGKEADIVFLVLGGDPKKEGAKIWASSKPNLANVAVSRAKRRLYVIGDHSAWSRHRFFARISRIPVESSAGRAVSGVLRRPADEDG